MADNKPQGGTQGNQGGNQGRGGNPKPDDERAQRDEQQRDPQFQRGQQGGTPRDEENEGVNTGTGERTGTSGQGSERHRGGGDR